MSAGAVPAAAITAAVDAARAFLRIEGDAEQALLERLATVAIGIGEAFIGDLFVTRLAEDVLRPGCDWQRLAATPVVAIAGVTALPAGGAPFVMPVTDYAIDIDPARFGWVRIGGPDRVAVSYSAGIAADWASLPAPLAQGVVALIAHLFDDRSATAQPPAAVSALWRPFRRLRLAEPVHLR